MRKNTRIKAKWGAGYRAQFEYLLKERPELLDKAVEIYRDNFFGETFVDCLTVISGAQELLKRLAKMYTLTIATGAHPKIITDRLFPKFGIPDVFAQVLTIYDIDDMAFANHTRTWLTKSWKPSMSDRKRLCLWAMRHRTCKWPGMPE